MRWAEERKGGTYGGADGDEGELAPADARRGTCQDRLRAIGRGRLLHALRDGLRDITQRLLALPEPRLVLCAPRPAHVPWCEDDGECSALEPLGTK